jgi:hypothetical protein
MLTMIKEIRDLALPDRLFRWAASLAACLSLLSILLRRQNEPPLLWIHDLLGRLGVSGEWAVAASQWIFERHGFVEGVAVAGIVVGVMNCARREESVAESRAASTALLCLALAQQAHCLGVGLIAFVVGAGIGLAIHRGDRPLAIYKGAWAITFAFIEFPLIFFWFIGSSRCQAPEAKS